MPDMTVELTNAARTKWTLPATGENDGEGNPFYAVIVFDGASRGVWTANAVVELAAKHGYARQLAPDDPDNASEEVDDAERHLNTITPDGVSFGWLEGDFFLGTDAWWAMANA